MKTLIPIILLIYCQTNLFGQTFDLILPPDQVVSSGLVEMYLTLNTEEENYKDLNDSIIYRLVYDKYGRVVEEYNFYFIDVMEFYIKKNHTYSNSRLIKTIEESKDRPRTKRHFELLDNEKINKHYKTVIYKYKNKRLSEEYNLKRKNNNDTVLKLKCSYTYNKKGQLKEKTNRIYPNGQSITSFIYNENNLVSEKEGEHFEKQYTYNKVGQLTEEKIFQLGALNETIRYHYLFGQLREESTEYPGGNYGIFKEYQYEENKLKSILWKLNKNDKTGIEFNVHYVHK